METTVEASETSSGARPLDGAPVRLLGLVLTVARVVLIVAGVGVVLAGVVAFVGVVAGGSASLPFLEVRSTAPWPVTAVGLLVTAGWVAVAFVLVDRLRAIVRTVAAGDPFIPANAERLRTIWMALAAYEGGRMVIGIWASAQIAAGDAHLQPLMTELQFNPTVWLAVLALMVLARVFREGARLRDEQQLTI